MSKKINGNKLFRRVNGSFKRFYSKLEKLADIGSGSKKNVYLYPEIKRMNKIMRKFYKRPELQITISDNLIPVKFEATDGAIISGMKYITDPNSKKWIIGNHWFAGHKYWSMYWAKPFIDLGYNVLTFDFRNHGDSEQGHYVTMGILEERDLLGAMKFLYENHDYDILGVAGASMGAFTMNYTSVRNPELMEKYKVKFGISEVAYGSIRTLLLHTRNIRMRHVLWKRSVKKFINKLINGQIKDTKLDWEDLDIFKYYEKMDAPAPFPIFYSHGMDDKVTPPSDTFRLYANRKTISPDDEILIYNFSAHCFSLKTHYYQTAYRWLQFENKIIGNDEATKNALEKLGISQEIIDNDFNESDEISTFYSNPTRKEIKTPIKKAKKAKKVEDVIDGEVE
ncbi:alpha/beta hydrolase family protein [[Acholeplasma] multilocale]|uniref:alpha/beta hydrolase family protein n=1 Tax=[Acholeplasma] multilocale TaxID=264638 RepID=UPI00244E0B8C|nr:hypothetical protein [[Acholeplasma] multilocale]